MPSKVDPRVRRAAREVGEQIRAARLDAELSQAALAARIGMTRTNYARVEHGETNVTIETLLRIARGLGLELKIALERKPAARAPLRGSHRSR